MTLPPKSSPLRGIPMAKIVYVHLSVKELKLMASTAESLARAASFIPEMKHIFEKEAEPSTTKPSTPSSP